MKMENLKTYIYNIIKAPYVSEFTMMKYTILKHKH